MAMHTLTALFASRDIAMAAAADLRRRGLSTDVRLSPERPTPEGGAPKASGFRAWLETLFGEPADRDAYLDAVGRGDTVLTAVMREAAIDAAVSVLDHHLSSRVDERNATWRDVDGLVRRPAIPDPAGPHRHASGPVATATPPWGAAGGVVASPGTGHGAPGSTQARPTGSPPSFDLALTRARPEAAAQLPAVEERSGRASAPARWFRPMPGTSLGRVAQDLEDAGPEVRSTPADGPAQSTSMTWRVRPGMAVVGSDGHRVGTVAGITREAVTLAVSGYPTCRRGIPEGWIGTVGDEVVLRLTGVDVERCWTDVT